MLASLPEFFLRPPDPPKGWFKNTIIFQQDSYPSSILAHGISFAFLRAGGEWPVYLGLKGLLLFFYLVIFVFLTHEVAMDSIYSIGLVSLPIPVWQLAFYIILVGLFMIGRRTNWCLLTTFLFGLYWGYYLFGHDLLNAARSSAAVLTVYSIFGLVLAAFSLIAIFYEER